MPSTHMSGLSTAYEDRTATVEERNLRTRAGILHLSLERGVFQQPETLQT